MRLSVSEILKLANSKSKVDERIAILHHHNCFALRHLLRFCFDPNIEWLVQGDYSYSSGSIIDQEGNLYSKARLFYLFVKAVNADGEWVIGNPALTDERRSMLFIQLLESIDKKDAELLLQVRKKNMPYKNVTEKVVLEAFPGLWS